MNAIPLQVHLLKMGELLNALRSETLSPAADVLRREAQASVFTTSQLVVDSVIRGLLDEPAERDRAREVKG